MWWVNQCDELNWIKIELTMTWKKLFWVLEKKNNLFGKPCVVYNLAVSKFIFIASIFPPKNYFIKKVNRAIFNFIWNILNRIKQNTLIRKIEEDGIVVIVKSAKTSWVETLSETFLTNQVIIAELQRSTLIWITYYKRLREI